MNAVLERPMTRDEIAWNEGNAAFRTNGTVKDNPYRPGSADDVAWQLGFQGEHLVYGRTF